MRVVPTVRLLPLDPIVPGRKQLTERCVDRVAGLPIRHSPLDVATSRRDSPDRPSAMTRPIMKRLTNRLLIAAWVTTGCIWGWPPSVMAEPDEKASESQQAIFDEFLDQESRFDEFIGQVQQYRPWSTAAELKNHRIPESAGKDVGATSNPWSAPATISNRRPTAMPRVIPSGDVSDTTRIDVSTMFDAAGDQSADDLLAGDQSANNRSADDQSANVETPVDVDQPAETPARTTVSNPIPRSVEEPVIHLNPWIDPTAFQDARSTRDRDLRSMSAALATARLQLTAPEDSVDEEAIDSSSDETEASDFDDKTGDRESTDISKKSANPIEDFAAFRKRYSARPRGPGWKLSFADAIQLGLVNNKEVAVIEPLPEVAKAVVGFERGVFDPVIGVSTFGGDDDRQVRSEIATFGAAVDSQQVDYFRPFNGLNQTYVRQRLATGGSYEIGFGTNYLRFQPDAPELIVPSGWESAINLEYTQPLLRGRGRVAAQRDLRIAAARSKQTEFEFRSKLRTIIRDVDLAYWDLAFFERRIQSSDAFVAIGKIFLEQETERQSLGQSARPQILQVLSVLNEFQVEQTKNRREREVAEMVLRTELGLAQLFLQDDLSLTQFDDRIMLPIEPVTSELMSVDRRQLSADIAVAMARPELGQQTAKIEEAKANYVAAKNKLLPDVNARVLYSKVGLEKNLGDSVGTIFDEGFDTYGVGVTFERRVGLRSEQAEVRQFYFQIATETARRAEIAHDIVGELRELLADIEGSAQLLRDAESYVRVLTEQQVALDELYKDGKVTLFQRLENIRSLQRAELDMQDRWGELARAIAFYRYERGDDAAEHGVSVQSCVPYAAR